MKKTVLVSAFLMGLSSSISAEELSTRPWFVVTGGGALASNASSKPADDTDRALSIGYGWDFSDYLAAEFNYAYLGEFTSEVSGADVHARTVMASLLPNIKFDRIRLFGRLGAGA